MRGHLRPYAFVIAGVMLGGLSPVFTKLLLLEDLSQSTVVAARYLLALVFLLPIGLSRRRPEGSEPPDRRAWVTLFLVGALGSGVGALLFTAAVDLASAGVVNSISKTAPIFVALFAYFTLREQVSYLRFLLVIVMVAADVLIAAGELTFSRELVSARLLGDGLALAAGVTRAAAEILGKSALRRFSPATVALWRFGVGFLVTGAVCAASGGYVGLAALSVRGWIILIALAGVSSSLAMALYYRGLAAIPVHVAVSLKLLGAIVTVVVSWIILGQELTPYHVAGIAVLISGAYLLVLRASHSPAEAAVVRAPARKLLARMRTRFVGLVIVLVAGSVAAVWYLSMRHSARLLQQQAELSIGEVAAVVVEFGGLEERPSWQSYQQYLERVVGHRVEGELYALEVVYVAALDERGNLGAFALARDLRLVDASGRPYARGDREAMKRLLAEMEDSAAARRHGITTATAQLVHGGRKLGTLKMGCARQMQEGMVGEIVGRSAVAALTVLLLASALAILGGGSIVEPVEELAAEMLGAANARDGPREPLAATDEVEEIRWAMGRVAEDAALQARMLAAMRHTLAGQMRAHARTGQEERDRRVVLALQAPGAGERPTLEELERLIEAFVRVVITYGGEFTGLQQECLLAEWGTGGYERDDPLRAGLAALELRRLAEESAVGQGMRMAVALSGTGDDPCAVLDATRAVAKTEGEILIFDAVLETVGEHLLTEPVEGVEGVRRLTAANDR